MLGNEVLFTGSDGGSSALGASAIWGTDGTVAGTVKLTPDGIYAQGSGPAPTGFTPFGGKDLFWAGSGLSAHPWVTDGTAAGTFQLSTTANNGNTDGFTVLGNKAVFTAFGTQLWVTDGTVPGTYEVTTIGSPTNFAVANGKAMFQGTDTSHGIELWITDGTFFGTSMLKDINTNTFHSSSPAQLTAVTLPCFAAGTRLQTARGEIAVEALRTTDKVITATGAQRAVRWIGHRAINLATHPRPWDVMPIRIVPDAFAKGQPHTTLRLSPDHAVFADGVLIPVRYLVNGTTIARETVTAVTWFHVELADETGAAMHDVLLAEGLPTESYLETGNRSSFAGETVTALHADFARDIWARHGCAPLVIDGPEVLALRSWLLERAADLGHGQTPDASIAFAIDAQPVPPHRQGHWFHLALPPTATTLHLRSRAAIPAEIEAGGTDTRRLGIALTGLVLDGKQTTLGNPRLASGWHPAEPALRWSNGCATIDVSGLRRISLALHDAPTYWLNDPAAAA